jgi:chromosome segregation ATPase
MRTKLYALAPLLALLLFAGAFVAWNIQHRQAEAERVAAEQVELQARREAELAARKAAFADAIAAQEKRRAERAEREARRQADQAARQELLDQRDELATRIATAGRDLARLGTAIANERDAVAILEREAAALASEQTALRELTAKAAANQTAVTQLLQTPPAPAATTPARQ